MAWPSHICLMSSLQWSSTTQPIGANSILFTSCCPYMYSYAIVGAMFVGHSIFHVVSVSGSNLSHKCSENALSTPTRIALKWSLNVLIVFLLHFVSLCVMGLFHTLCHFSLLCWETLLMLHCWGCLFLLSLHSAAILAWVCCMLYIFPLMFGFSLVPQGLGSHQFCTVPWCICCLGLTL